MTMQEDNLENFREAGEVQENGEHVSERIQRLFGEEIANALKSECSVWSGLQVYFVLAIKHQMSS